MGMKFLNKKGWHTGSLRNIENVWKAEEKHGQEQKKLEELRKQIQEERQRSEFRQLQEQAGLVPRQERLEFLYESGLAVGKGSSSSDVVFQALDPSLPASDNKTVLPPPPSSSSSAPTQQALVPGALFEEKPQSANDAWRKLHSDPLLLIRQREQESLARVKNNPVQMAIIRNSVEAKKGKEKVSKSKEHREKKRHKKKSKHHKYSSEEEETTDDRAAKRSSKSDNKISDNTDYHSEREQRKKHHNDSLPSFEELERSTYTRDGNYISEREERDAQRKNHDRHHHRDLSYDEEERSKNTRGGGGGGGKSSRGGKAEYISGREERDTQRKNHHHHHHHHHHRDSSDDEKERLMNARGNGKSSRRDDVPDKIKSKYDEKDKVESRIDHDSGRRREKDERHSHHQASDPIQSVHNRRPYNRNVRSSTQLSAEERAAKLREMQIDAEVHEESRWKRIKKADEIDTMQEAANTMRNATSSDNSKNFLDAAKRSVYGAEKGGSATIEESVRRRTHYLQSRSEVGQGNAFRR